MGTPWDARTYDDSSQPQQAWASEVLARLDGIPEDATVLDVGCGTGRVTEALLALVPRGRVLALDASADMVTLARRRLGDRAEVWCQDVLDLDLDEPVDAIVSTATLHWVTDHDRLWRRLAQALRPGGVLEVQCGGEGNIDRVREVIEAVARDAAPELVGWSPWMFAGPQETERRLHEAGFTAVRCWLTERPTSHEDVDAFVRTSILPAHLARLPDQRRDAFAAAVVAGVQLPLDYVRLNVSAVRGHLPYEFAAPLRTDRLVLRTMTTDDIDDIHAYQSREDVCAYLPFGPRTRDQVAEKVTEYSTAIALTGDRDYWQLAIERASDPGHVIGDLYFTIKSTANATGEIGWTLHPDFMGQGYMTEAAGAILEIAFARLGLHRVSAELDARNDASAALCTRLGMREEAHFVEDLWFKGSWGDSVIYAILDREWAA
jgi:RimJ/RimL family protein N-acetyltransferase/trans-aconitate methyltransferase